MPVTRSRVALGALLLALVGIAAVVRPDTVMGELRSVLFSPWFPVVLLGLYLLRPFLGWPIIVLSGLVGFRYGVVLGLPIALVGVVGTSLIPYAAGRHFELDGPIWGWFIGGSERYFRTAGDLRGIIAARLAPTPAEPVSAAAGFGGVPFVPFVLGTLIGELPWTIAAVTLGHSLSVYSVRELAIDWRLAVAGTIAAFLLLAGPLYRVYRRRQTAV